MTKTTWTPEECHVLVATFFALPFSAGDDERLECHFIACEFGKSTGTVDRQWRNVADVLKGLQNPKIGRHTRGAVNRYLKDPRRFRRVALLYCRRNGWRLGPLITRQEDQICRGNT